MSLQSDLQHMRAIAFKDAHVVVDKHGRLRSQRLLDGLGGFLDDLHCRSITCIYGIQALLLLSRIAAVIVSRLPVQVCLRLTCKASPAPEVQSCEKTVLVCRLHDASEHMSVIFVTRCRRRALSKLEIIARESEFLEHDRLSILLSEGKMLVDVLIGIGYGLRKISLEGVFAHPAPVVRPDMDVQVIDVRA